MTLKLAIEQGGILEHDEAESKKQTAAVWYKDEGGQHKCILLKVSLEDDAGRRVKTKDVRVACVLYYAETGKKVETQSILRVWTDDGRKRGLVLRTGQVAIKARIEDVSKNHQGQCFTIEVSAEDEDGVVAGRSRAVHVRSKRNKRRRASTSPPRTRTPLPQVSETIMAPSVATWIRDVITGLDTMRWQVEGADHRMRNPNATIDALQQRYEAEVAPHMDGPPAKKRKPRPALAPPPMSRMRTSAGLTLDLLDAAEAESALHALASPTNSITPPVLQRGVSSVYTGGPAGDGSGSGADAPLPPFVETAGSRAEEARVRVVLAKRFRPVRDAAPLGFPAYDADKSLVGLYRDQGGTPVFVPASDGASGLAPEDLAAARAAYDRETSAKSDCVHDLGTYGSLGRLREAALLYCYSKEPWAELDLE